MNAGAVVPGTPRCAPMREVWSTSEYGWRWRRVTPRACAGANGAHEDGDAETVDDVDAVERDARELKTFDLTSKFGPCCGLTRIERWDRARALGLDPPKRVLEILHRRGEASARWRECVWHGRV